MERDRENLWTRRSNKLSLSTSNTEINDGKADPPTRNVSASKRFGGDSSSSHGGRSNPFNAMSPLTTSNIASPTTGASTAFGLGSGAFASFGSASKTPKTPGTAFDFSKAASGSGTPSRSSERRDRTGDKTPSRLSKSNSHALSDETSGTDAAARDYHTPWPLKYAWVIWYRPPTSKNSDYEKSIKPMCRMETAQNFWTVYAHLKRPSALPTVSDYHIFKEGIRPVWEDDENKRGGKWIMRLKKGVADRYWEDLLLALVGDQFFEAGEEVCGAVLSVRSGEDVLSVWTKNDGGRNIKIRETIKRVLALPTDTVIVWKSHDDSIAQRTAIDQARQEKAHHQVSDKRRMTLSDDATVGKDRS